MLLGWSIIILGIVACFLGAVLMHDLQKFSWASFLVPIALPVGVLMAASLVLEGMGVSDVWC